MLIVVDALRPDHLGLYGYERPTSPHLDEWAAQSAVFERAFTTSPWTLPAFGSLLTGEIPARHGAGSRVRASNWTVSSRVDDSLPTLPERLLASGFTTGAIVNNPWLPPAVGLDRGFAEYDYQRSGESDHRRADEVVDLALAWIDRNAGTPFFLMVHVLDPHMSYDAPPPFRGRFTSGLAGSFVLPVGEPRKMQRQAESVPELERAFVRAAYDEEIAFVSEELGRLLAGLRERDLWNRMIVVLTADHGEELFDHEGFEHGHSVYQELLHVPLVIGGPGVRPAHHAEPVSIVDIPRTILDALGVERGDSLVGSAGLSLWPVVTQGDVVPSRLLTAEGTLYGSEQRAAIQWPLKLTVDIGSGRRRLYHLERDPGEQTDLAPTETRAVRFLSQELSNTLREAREGVQSEDVPLDEATIEELRSLGYVN
ncbi:MAG: sulfatase [Vicinamibacteria bacterium]